VAVLPELEGHHIELAFDGEEAVRKFRKRSFDVTFMDVRLPGMNGVESFFELRKIKPYAKVVMMTAYSVEDLLTRALDAGALGVLAKPFGADEVLQSCRG
jgi:DNA-binding response OmpR family regulator